MLNCDEVLFFYLQFLLSSVKVILRLVKLLEAQRKSAPMNAN